MPDATRSSPEDFDSDGDANSNLARISERVGEICFLVVGVAAIQVPSLASETPFLPALAIGVCHQEQANLFVLAAA
jgi:hypothetical protein